MSDPRDDDVSEELAVQYVLGELSAVDAASFEKRLAEDAALAREVARLRNVLDMMPYAALTEPPPALRDKVLAAAAELDAAPRGRKPRRVLWSRFAAAAAAVLALTLGIENFNLQRELALEREMMTTLREPNIVQTFRLAGTADARGSFGQVALDLDAKKGAVVLKSLPQLPADKVYRLWARVGEARVPCGQFGVDPTGAVLGQFVVPVESYSGPIAELLLTIEPSTLPAEPTGPVVMQSI